MLVAEEEEAQVVDLVPQGQVAAVQAAITQLQQHLGHQTQVAALEVLGMAPALLAVQVL
jgi:hypothetical protein